MEPDFFVTIQHDLKSPLSSIIGYSLVLLEESDGPLNEQQKQDVTAIHDAGKELLRILNSIIDLQKTQGDQLELVVQEFDLNDQINRLMAVAQTLIKDRPVQFQTDIAPDLPHALGDEYRTEQIITRLVSNACQFTRNGRITLTAQPVVEDQCPMVHVSVQDTGCGIAAQDLPHLFDAFKIRQLTHPPHRWCYGLGLPLAKSLAELQGGRLWVENEPNVGSTFHFTLPTMLPDPGEA